MAGYHPVFQQCVMYVKDPVTHPKFTPPIKGDHIDHPVQF
jgi:hypothetical protein